LKHWINLEQWITLEHWISLKHWINPEHWITLEHWISLKHWIRPASTWSRCISFFSAHWIIFNGVCDTVFLTDLIINFRTGTDQDSVHCGFAVQLPVQKIHN